MTECVLPGQGEVHLNASLQILILLLQNLDLLFKEHVLLGLLKSRTQPQPNISFTRQNDHHVHPDQGFCYLITTFYLLAGKSKSNKSKSLGS